ncbi:MAG: oligosaccharide flippase family protein [Rhodocyclaceae bacterium]|nr:oligosaccharide flippase family protein [Rhodocyclaceae bacterium]
MAESLKRRTLGNLALSGGMRVATIALQVAVNVVLARNLSSIDYGIVSYAQIVVTLLALLSECGLSSVAVQSPDLPPKALQTGFTLRLALSAAAVAIILLAGPAIAGLLGAPAVAPVMNLLAVGFVINSLSFVPSVLLLRALDYRTLVSAQTVGALVNAAVATATALAGWGYWSVAAGMIASACASTIHMNLSVRARTNLGLDLAEARRYLSGGLRLLSAGLLTVFIMNADNLVVGTFRGPEMLGFYALAFGWGSKICDLLASVLNSVIFPTFARIQSDPARLGDAFLKTLLLAGFISFGGHATLFLVSEDLLRFLLADGSEKWLPALETLRWFCLYGMVRAPLEAFSSLMMSAGRFGTVARANMATALVMAILLFPALEVRGIEGVALAVAIGYGAQYLVYWPEARRLPGLTAARVAASLAPGALAAAILVAAALIVPLERLAEGQVRFWAGLCTCGIAYLALFGMVTGGRPYREVFAAFRMRRTERTG